MAAELGFPLWLRLTHFFNFMLMTLLVRSGIQILADHPRLYWNDYCKPDSEWIRFTKKKVPKDKLYTSMDDAIKVSPWLALPGGFHKLAAGRHWHYFSAFFWLLNGLLYLGCLFTTEHWHRLIPTSFDIIPEVWHVLTTYLHFELPPQEVIRPYNALQQLTYAFVVFVMSPLIILTGLVQSPAIAGSFPWSARLLGGHQPARSIHFLLATGFVLFSVLHVVMVLIERFPLNMLHIVLGREHGEWILATKICLAAIAGVLVLNGVLVWWNWRFPRAVKNFTGMVVDTLIMKPLTLLKSRQAHSRSHLGQYFWVNGRPPEDEQWKRLAENDFKKYRLEIRGLVEKPMLIPYAELKTLRKEISLTEHICIQGWSGFAEWGGVPLSEVIRMCRPKPSAAYIIFNSFQRDEHGLLYYTSLTLEEAMHPQTILAYEMNGEPLPINHGAPLRLRMETMLGFKMCKWIECIEFVDSLSEVGLGYGGYHEDRQYYSVWARI